MSGWELIAGLFLGSAAGAFIFVSVNLHFQNKKEASMPPCHFDFHSQLTSWEIVPHDFNKSEKGRRRNTCDYY